MEQEKTFGQKELSPVEKAGQKLEGFSDGDLKKVWEALRDYDHDKMYDDGISMDQWAMMVKSEIDRREKRV